MLGDALQYVAGTSGGHDSRDQGRITRRDAPIEWENQAQEELAGWPLVEQRRLHSAFVYLLDLLPRMPDPPQPDDYRDALKSVYNFAGDELALFATSIADDERLLQELQNLLHAGVRDATVPTSAQQAYDGASNAVHKARCYAAAVEFRLDRKYELRALQWLTAIVLYFMGHELTLRKLATGIKQQLAG